MITVGIGGYARAGKDTTAQVFVEDYAFVRYGFADALRQMSEVLDPGLNITTSAINEPKYIPLSRILQQTGGWDDAKTTFPSVRQWLQRLGTEAGRQILGDTIWVDTLFKNARLHGHELVVIPDVRFHNELGAVQSSGSASITIWVSRPGVCPVNAHASDNTLGPDDFDIVLDNDGDINQLHQRVAGIVEGTQLLS